MNSATTESVLVGELKNQILELQRKIIALQDENLNLLKVQVENAQDFQQKLNELTQENGVLKQKIETLRSQEENDEEKWVNLVPVKKRKIQSPSTTSEGSDLEVDKTHPLLVPEAGVSVSDSCKSMSEQIRKREKYRYAILVIKDDRVFEIESKGERRASYADFLKAIKKSGTCRYGLYSFELATNPIKEEYCLIAWAPDTAPLKDKLMYCAYFIALKTTLGIEACIDSTCDEEIAKECVEQQLLQLD